MLQAKNSGSAHTNPNYQTLLAFKPRQVLLAERSTKVSTTMKQCSNRETPALNPDQKALLLQSVLGYLERNGFSKALKRLLSEAQIETNNWKACSLNLEDLYGKYLATWIHEADPLVQLFMLVQPTSETYFLFFYQYLTRLKITVGFASETLSARAETNLDTYKNQELLTDGTNKKSGDSLGSAIELTVGDKKKKKSNKGETNAVENRSENGIAESSKNSTEILVKDSLASPIAELKAKKKSKKVQTEQVITQALKESTADTVGQLQIDGSLEKKTDKKKKKSKSISEPHDAHVEPVPVDPLPAANEENSKLSLDEVKIDSEAEGKSKDKKKKKKKQSMGSHIQNVDKSALENMHDVPLEEKKSSKKRKRLASEENEVHPVEKLASEESKRRKTVTLVETKICEKITETEAPTNRNFQKDGAKSATPKTRRKQHEGSAEPRTVNAFQRVKIDEVKYADERLQDNSYWAKSGADIGYGAKAQEILGQVKGRDFRHEKTKKKRGSYRGGQIDLQAHSVKFNYSDED
ncbi:hypothetical protein RHSIM_Rhsim01G0114500 [Rhododendron simsii]|uniref:Srp40 C-terminal domain-containing protein n=1 Tax=Rhododendron simsii TaxID=118357 RepID=A0A834LY72_RHOSS|nr:hypothetical protein RHSIM_Rhsim01G0114500 [Rhododendron simsii]